MMNFLRCNRRLQYARNEFGDQEYPKKRNGSEYYLYDRFYGTLFAVDRIGAPRYARDAEGNELYPKRDPIFLRHPRFDTPVYARDAFGNETYPKRGGREVFAQLSDGEMLAARYVSGRQRYPRDRRGNDYFPLCKKTGKPYYLRDEKGYAYRPTTVNGYALYLTSEEGDEEDRLYEMKDAEGTTVYTADYKMERRSFWTHVKEACMVGGCCLFQSLDLCCKLLF